MTSTLGEWSLPPFDRSGEIRTDACSLAATRTIAITGEQWMGWGSFYYADVLHFLQQREHNKQMGDFVQAQYRN